MTGIAIGNSGEVWKQGEKPRWKKGQLVLHHRVTISGDEEWKEARIIDVTENYTSCGHPSHRYDCEYVDGSLHCGKKLWRTIDFGDTFREVE